MLMLLPQAPPLFLLADVSTGQDLFSRFSVWYLYCACKVCERSGLRRAPPLPLPVWYSLSTATPTGRTYSLNEAREPDWPEGLRRYISDMKTGAGQTGEEFDLVYVCSLVADVHYTLFEGGIAMNPRYHALATRYGSTSVVLR